MLHLATSVSGLLRLLRLMGIRPCTLPRKPGMTRPYVHYWKWLRPRSIGKTTKVCLVMLRLASISFILHLVSCLSDANFFVQVFC